MIYKILELNAEINVWYRSSKLPKIVKKYMSKYKRSKLKKMVNRYTDTNKRIYITSDIYEFISFMVSNRITNNFMYIDSIGVYDEKENPVYFANLSFKDKNNRGICIFIFNDIKPDSFVLNIKFKDERGLKTIKSINCDEMGLLGIGEDRFDKGTIAVIRGLNRMIAEMINKMIYDEFERSERIYEI